MDRVKNCVIDICTISDHNSVSAVISPPYPNPASRHWRLQSSLLSNPKFLEFLGKEWVFFMDSNKKPDTDPSLLWETAKAYIRGSIISYSAAQKKSLLEKQLELEQLVKDLENKFNNSPSHDLRKELDVARSALNQILTRKAETSILFARQRLYEYGNKPGRLLARLARGRNEASMISSLKDGKGSTTYDSKQINNIMRQFYQKLYFLD